MKMIFAAFFFILTGCTLFEPSVLVIKNNSDYEIEISTNTGNIREFVLEKDKGEFIMSPPGNLNLTVSIGKIKFKKVYNMTLGYLEKKKFDFTLND